MVPSKLSAFAFLAFKLQFSHLNFYSLKLRSFILSYFCFCFGSCIKNYGSANFARIVEKLDLIPGFVSIGRASSSPQSLRAVAQDKGDHF